MRHNYSVLAIARRHPKLFNKLVKASELLKEKQS